MNKAFDSWEEITEDDAALESALKSANIPALMVALVHITGDASIIRGTTRPDYSNLLDPHIGITRDQRAEIRAAALDALKTYRDGGCTPPAPLTTELIREMLAFIAGCDLSENYVEFLMGDLSLEGEDPYRQPGMDLLSAKKRQAFRVVIIGAGMSGILAGFRLKEAGIPFTIVDKNGDVGGTWLENTYPGCRVDSPNHTYSYSFLPNDWPQYYSPQKTLLDYFQRFASDFGIQEHIRFNTEVESVVFDEQNGSWIVTVRQANGDRAVLEANAVIGAVGQLNRPRLPDIEGVEKFDGPNFHTACWEHDHDFSGKRIAVIGTGASAFQSVPEIAKQARDVFVFQRTPPWISIRPEYHDFIPDGKHWLLHHIPFYAKWFRFYIFWRSSEGLLEWVKKDDTWEDQTRSVGPKNDELRRVFTKRMSDIIGDDPDLLQKCIPDFPPAGKRMLVDNGTWLRALKRENVELITDPILEITETGLATESGASYEVDVLIYATGFYPGRILWPMEIRGIDGLDLQTHWDGDPHAYKGVSIPNFPNFFCMYGPNTNIVVNGSIIFFSECEMRYILGCIKLLIEHGHKAMDVHQNVHDDYNEWVDAGNENMAWGAPDVRSWYKNEKGRVTQNWPYSMMKFWAQSKAHVVLSRAAG